MSEHWTGVKPTPPGFRLGDLERSVELRSSYDENELFPMPCFDVELAVFSRPSASVCFPVHPVGVIKVYEAAAEVFGGLNIDLKGVGKCNLKLVTGAAFCVALLTAGCVGDAMARVPVAR